MPMKREPPPPRSRSLQVRRARLLRVASATPLVADSDSSHGRVPRFQIVVCGSSVASSAYHL